MTTSNTALVIGGGVIGMMSARALRAAGFAVTLLEAGSLGSEASSAGGGILSPLPPWQAPTPVWGLASDSIDQYPTLCTELAASTGIDPEWHLSGMLVLGDLPATATAWASAVRRELKPDIAPRSAVSQTAVLLPWVGQVRNNRLCRALAVALHQSGVIVHEKTPVQTLRKDGDSVVAVTATQNFRADVTVLAAGAWSAALGATLEWPIPVAPVKGQMIVLRGPPDLLPHIMLAGDRYLIPRQDGHILVGSTVEHQGFNKQLDAEAAQSLKAFASALCPKLAQMETVAHWSGLRPGAPEGIPLIAQHPELPGVFVNTGHFRNGLTLAPACATLLVSLIQANS